MEKIKDFISGLENQIEKFILSILGYLIEGFIIFSILNLSASNRIETILFASLIFIWLNLDSSLSMQNHSAAQFRLALSEELTSIKQLIRKVGGITQSADEYSNESEVESVVRKYKENSKKREQEETIFGIYQMLMFILTLWYLLNALFPGVIELIFNTFLNRLS